MFLDENLCSSKLIFHIHCIDFNVNYVMFIFRFKNPFFNGLSTFVDYLMWKPFSEKSCCGTIKSIAVWGGYMFLVPFSEGSCTEVDVMVQL